MTTCPFCANEINFPATVCAACGATKGYGNNNHGGVHNKTGIILLAVFCVVLMLFGFWVGEIAHVFTFMGMLGLPFCLWPLLRGPRWYR